MKRKETKELGTLKIIKEKEEVFVRMDIEMDKELTDFLVDYAWENIPLKVEQELLVSWAFNDILKKQLKKMK
jgi:hypothetical protein